MKSYDADLRPLEEKLEFARGEVNEEIALASEQSADADRELQLIQYNVQLMSKRRISDCLAEVRKGGALQRVEAKADKLFRTKQTEQLAEIRRLEIERIIKEEGTDCFIRASLADLADI